MHARVENVDRTKNMIRQGGKDSEYHTQNQLMLILCCITNQGFI